MPPFLVRADLTASGSTVILMVEGYDIAVAAEKLKEITPALRHTEPRGMLQTPVSWPLVVQMANVLGPERLEMGERLTKWVSEQIAIRNQPAPLTCEVNHGAPPPRDYQVEGAEMIANTKRLFLFDDMGVGKSLTSLLGLLELRARGELTGASLVVCPASVVDSWVEAAQRWTPFTPVAYRGPWASRGRLARRGDLLVCSYEVATRDHDGVLARVAPQALVVDEIHRIKDPDAKRSRAIRKLSEGAEIFVGLSGTPITHSSKDLWPALYCLDRAGWPEKPRFARRYMEGDLLHPDWESEFRRCLHGQHRRKSKADVLTQLPPKNYSVRYVELPPAARKVYDAMESELVAEIEGGELTAMSVLAQLTRLNQLASATGSIHTTTKIDKHGEEVEQTHVTLKLPSWKVDALMDVLEEREGHQTLVFAPSRQLVMLAGQKAEAAGYKTGYIIGEQKPKERTDTVNAFQDGKLDVIMATTGAGGVGLTLTAADAVVFIQRPWSFVDAAQAEDRAHRLGSEIHESIDVIDIVAKSTVDEYVRKILKGKSGALAELLDDKRIALECLGGLK